MARKLITCCPHCGSEDGFYTLSDYINVRVRSGFDGREMENGEMYDGVDIRYHRYAYCISCDGVICNATTLFRQIEEASDGR